MNKAGYVDIGTMYELPLDCLRSKLGHTWRLRDCSFALVSESLREMIANRVSSWQPRFEGHTLCQKLDRSHLLTDDLVCWVETPSKKLVDCNGVPYNAYGPCVVAEINLEKVRIHVVSSRVQNPYVS